MKRILAVTAVVLFAGGVVIGQQSSTTPNIGLKIPYYGTQDWYAPISYDLTQLDLFLSGHLPVPGLTINGNLQVNGNEHVTGDVVIDGTLTAPGFTPSLASVLEALGYQDGVTGPLTYLRIKPNALPAKTSEFKTLPTYEVQDYDFPAITPGGTLTAATPATVTLPFSPLGLNGTDTHHYIYVSAGTGTAEPVLITGGTCTSGLLSACTVQFTPANNHSGEWNITSATAGFQEARNVSYANGGRMHAKSAAYNTHAPIYLDLTENHGFYVEGDGPGYFNLTEGTIVNNQTTTLTSAFIIHGSSLTTGCEVGAELKHMTIHGSNTSGIGIQADNACPLYIDDVFEVGSQLQGMTCDPNCFGITINNSKFYSNGLEGLKIVTAANNVKIHDSKFQDNCKQAPGVVCNGLTVNGGLNVDINGNDFSLNGGLPLGAYSSSGNGAGFYNIQGLHIIGNYCEQSLSNCIVLDPAVSGFEISGGNYFQQGGIDVQNGARSGTITGNKLISGNTTVNVTAVVSNGGLCQYTLASAPTPNYTAGSFVNVASIVGATACNGSQVIQSIQSSTQFTGSLAFGSAYVSGGVAQKIGGFQVGGVTGGYADVHIFGNDLRAIAGPVYAVGGDLLPGFGATLPSGTLIVTNQFHKVSGTAAIGTIIPPSGYEGNVCLIATGAWSTVTSDNIETAFTASAGQKYCLAYNATDNKWY
jgi:hypothetical protein